MRATPIGVFLSLCLWPVALMSSFSRGTQRVNGCRDYAMACQKLFSSMPPSSPPPQPTTTPLLLLPLSSNRPEPNEAFLHVWTQMHVKAFGAGRGRKQGSCFRLKASFPFTTTTTCPPFTRGKRCREDLQPLRRATSLQSVEPVETSAFDFLTATVKPGLSLTASQQSSSSRSAPAEVKHTQPARPIRKL